MAAMNVFPRTLTGYGDAQPVPSATVTDDFFDVMGVHPVQGRAFAPDELVSGQTNAVILSDGLWRSTFGSRTDLLERAIQLDGRSFQVVGVMPPGFDYPSGAKLWTPWAFSADEMRTQRGAHYLTVVARLRDGVAMDAAVGELAGIARHLAELYPGTNKDDSATARSLRDDLVGATPRRALIILLGAVALVTLIACANVANLLLARGEARRRELAMRASLGARPRDLIGMALTESVLLSLAGGAAGVLVAWMGTRVLDAMRPADLRSLGAARVDLPVLGFALGLSVLTGLLFGLAPAIQAVRAGVAQGALRPDSRGSVGSREGWRARSLLVAAELALAVMLLAGAGLLTRSFARLQGVAPGFNASGVLTFQLSLPDARYPDANRSERFYEQLLDGIRAMPGVASADAISGLPLDDYDYQISTHSLDGRTIESSVQPSTQIRLVTGGFFRTLGIRLRRGRTFTDADRDGAPNVVVMNEAAARLLFKGQDALGHALEIGTGFGLGRGRAGGEVVGIVDDVHDDALGTPPRPTIYLAHAQFPVTDMAVAVRAAAGVDPISLAGGGARRGARARRGPADAGGAHHGPGVAAVGGAAAVRDGAPGGVRARRAGAVGGGDLRRDELRGGPTHPRDRRADGTRRRRTDRRRRDGAPGTAADRARGRGRARGGIRADKRNGRAAVRRGAAGPSDLRQRRGRAGRGGHRCRVASGAARESRRSGGGAAKRVMAPGGDGASRARCLPGA